MTARQANRDRWTEIVAEYRRSGMSKPDFAEKNGLKLKDLQNWSYRLPKPKRAGRRRSARGQVRLLPVAVRPSAPGPIIAGGQVLVDIRSLQVAVPSDADPRQVAALICAVREIAC